MMEKDLVMFFNKCPQALPLYAAFEEMIRVKYPGTTVKIQKSQISMSNKHPFAFIWLPIRKMKNRPDIYVILSFGLPYRLDSPRIAEATEPYPNRWTHHVIIQDKNELDSELMNWIDEAYAFAMRK
ncbi:MAG: DUF5655 domain-containing protein [Bacillota bacterium]|nr:DUF5655 domain-containing protein [Bacillota bacterium]